MNVKKTRWTVSFKDACDGSGDAIVEFPDELISLLGWQVGDQLDVQWTADKRGLILQKVQRASPDSL
jgi:hypothetical protein